MAYLIKFRVLIIFTTKYKQKFLQDSVDLLSLWRGNNFTLTSISSYNNQCLYSRSWLAAEFDTSAHKKGIDIPGLFLVKKWTKAPSKCLSFASCFCPVLKLDIHKK